MESAANAPMPGSTPIKLPMNTPIKEYMRLLHVGAVANPKITLSKNPMASYPHVNNGNCMRKPKWNTAIANNVTARAATKAVTTELSGSPNADTRTTTNVAGTRPPYFPSMINSTTATTTQTGARQGCLTTSSDSSA